MDLRRPKAVGATPPAREEPYKKSPWAPLRTLNPRVQGTRLAALAGPRNTPTRASGHGGGYIYINK